MVLFFSTIILDLVLVLSFWHVVLLKSVNFVF